MSLGGIPLCIIGLEAMFVDLGALKLSINISVVAMVYSPVVHEIVGLFVSS